MACSLLCIYINLRFNPSILDRQLVSCCNWLKSKTVFSLTAQSVLWTLHRGIVSHILFLFNLNLERDFNNLAITRFQAALMLHNLVQILQICRGRGRSCKASGQAGKARCAKTINVRPSLPAKRSVKFDYLCSLDRFVEQIPNRKHGLFPLGEWLGSM